MATEVRHGASPKFRAKVLPGAYELTVRGRYTKTPGLAAAGVTRASFNSRRPSKRLAELLALRTAFLVYFVVEANRLGMTWKDAVDNVHWFPFRKIRRRLLKARRQKVKAF